MESSKTVNSTSKINNQDKCKCNSNLNCLDGFCAIKRPFNSPLIQPQNISINDLTQINLHLPTNVKMM